MGVCRAHEPEFLEDVMDCEGPCGARSGARGVGTRRPVCQAVSTVWRGITIRQRIVVPIAVASRKRAGVALLDACTGIGSALRSRL